jgi:uncharacterized protein (TIGR02246 family)
MRRIMLSALLALAGLALALGQPPKTDEEKAVRAAIDSYTAAYNKGDLASLLAHVAPDVDLIEETGTKHTGKANLAELCKRSLADGKGQKLKTTVTSLRFLRPDVAMVDGKADIIGTDGSTSSGRFSAIWAKTDGKWLLKCVHDLADSSPALESGAAQLTQLDWLIGDWAYESPNYSVQVNARWTLNKSFLLVEYVVKGKENEDLSVTQFFGWDPVEGVISSWFFDSQGGFGAGDWVREGNTWTAEWSGVLSDGRTGSSVNSMKFIDDKSFLFRSADRQIDGVPMSDIEVKFVRKSGSK